MDSIHRTPRCLRRSLRRIMLVSMLWSCAATVLPLDLAAAGNSCVETPTPSCVLRLAADDIEAQLAAFAGRDPLLAYVERPLLLRLLRDTAADLANAGDVQRAVRLIQAAEANATERARLVIDVAQRAPRFSRSPDSRPIIEESLHALYPFVGWLRLASAPYDERQSRLRDWQAAVALGEEAGIHGQVLVSLQAAKAVLTTQLFEGLTEDVRTEFAIAVTRAALSAREPALAEQAAGKVMGAQEWSAARIEVAAGYAREDDTSRASTLLQGYVGEMRVPATRQMFLSYLRRGNMDQAWSTLLALPPTAQAEVLIEAARSVDPKSVVAVFNVASRTAQSLARNALVRRFIAEGDFHAALQQAVSISDAWVRHDALAILATEAALAGQVVTAQDARQWLASTLATDIAPEEHFAAAFVAAFSRIATGNLANGATDLETLQSRLATLEKQTIGRPDLFVLNVDALRAAIGGEEAVVDELGRSAAALFGRAFVVGTVYGMGGSDVGGVVAHALAAIAAIDDAQVRAALLQTLGRQMLSHEPVVRFSGS